MLQAHMQHVSTTRLHVSWTPFGSGSALSVAIHRLGWEFKGAETCVCAMIRLSNTHTQLCIEIDGTAQTNQVGYITVIARLLGIYGSKPTQVRQLCQVQTRVGLLP